MSRFGCCGRIKNTRLGKAVSLKNMGVTYKLQKEEIKATHEEYLEKGQNQNKLTDDNIKKIFATYKERKEIAKYSHRASLAEIKENEYNLNIPRYVDTFEEEELIDIETVSKELKTLYKDEISLQSKIVEFCDELKIGKPF